MCWENYFAKPTISVRSCLVCTFQMSLLWEGKDVMNALEGSCTAIPIIQNCAEYNHA